MDLILSKAKRIQEINVCTGCYMTAKVNIRKAQKIFVGHRHYFDASPHNIHI